MPVLSNLGFSAAALILCLTALWAISLKIKDASIIDIFWGAGFAVVGLVCLWRSEEITPYIALICALPIIWGIRLSLYLAKRNLGHGEDKRYIAMRKRSGLDEMVWRQRAFWTIFMGQGLLIILVSAPVRLASATGFHLPGLADGGNRLIARAGWDQIYETPIGAIAIIGTLIWLIGFLFEAIGDRQLTKFIKANKAYDGPVDDKPVMDKGLWKYTRHPNYFGNACMWWGIWIVACAAPFGWLTIFAPIIMTILLTRVSGRDLLERSLKKRKNYRDYAKRTSGFFPLPPKK